jgi:hypothetical protein
MSLNLAKFVPTVHPSSSMGVITTSTILKVMSVLVNVLVEVATTVVDVRVAVLVTVIVGYLL